jgi:hypothetical protein
MEENELILTITQVTRKPAHPWVNQFNITLHNSLDNTDTFTNNNSEDIPGYLERSERELYLDSIRKLIYNNIRDSKWDEKMKTKVVFEKEE